MLHPAPSVRLTQRPTLLGGLPMSILLAGSQEASASVKAGRLEIATPATVGKERPSAFGTILLIQLVSRLSQRTWGSTDKY